MGVLIPVPSLDGTQGEEKSEFNSMSCGAIFVFGHLLEMAMPFKAAGVLITMIYRSPPPLTTHTRTYHSPDGINILSYMIRIVYESIPYHS